MGDPLRANLELVGRPFGQIATPSRAGFPCRYPGLCYVAAFHPLRSDDWDELMVAARERDAHELAAHGALQGPAAGSRAVHYRPGYRMPGRGFAPADRARSLRRVGVCSACGATFAQPPRGRGYSLCVRCR